ncbi:DUF1553 domain-containing protein [Planctomicrobium sp. SH661]|uniref:DUF1553 domain-containing protein n=1 Tax=Planctomicrobium sp. SH661 TaxID=3448124 RepID=UPI003F5CAF17
MNISSKRELLELTEALCEETASAADVARLEQLVLSSPELRQLYVEAMSLHGMLHWDAAGSGAELESGSAITAAVKVPKEFVSGRREGARTPRRFRRLREIAAGLAVLVLLKVGFALFDSQKPEVAQGPVAPQAPEIVQENAGTPEDVRSVPDVRLSVKSAPVMKPEDASSPVEESVTATNPAARLSEYKLTSDAEMVSRINERLLAKWEEARVVPAPVSDDAEWVRRAYLDLAGRIPTGAEAEAFFQNSDRSKRQDLVDSLLNSREFARNLATVWTNLLVGRSPEMKIDRDRLLGWLEDEFASDRPWRETVTDLVAARGTSQESGPANFLLAHLNNEAVPATAITSRIFLCEQLQCTQCHQHPLVKSWGQERFWELNAFFQQARIRDTRVVDAASGKKRDVPELVDAEEFGPTYYETLRGVMRVAYPKFAGVEISTEAENPQLPLREQLAGLLFADAHPQPARAFVNRTWAFLMGQGFTTPVDDMGPHTPVSHPELLEDLTAAFVQSGYDVDRLVRWICLSDAYQLASRADSSQGVPGEESGELPLFSQMAIKPLSAEQLFDSLRIASGVSPQVLMSRSTQQQRETWLRQFYAAVDTEENGESSTFDGSLPRALMMMNGDLVQQATSPRESRILEEITTPHGISEADRIRQLSLAALSRYPTNDELTQLRDLLRRTIRQRVSEENLSPQLALAEGLKDVYWAYLNSSEFVVNH